MKKYIVTSETLNGEIIYKFNAEGKFTCIDIQGQVDETQRKWLLQFLPQDETVFWNLIKQSKKLKAAEVPFDLSFDNFFNLYNYRVGKKEAQKAYERLSDEQKTKAILAIAAYDKHWTAKGQAKAYASTYINKEYYLDEYK